MKKIKIVVLSGGKSSERDISLSSGREVVKKLDKSKYSIYSIIVPKSGSDWFKKILRLQPDVVFIAMHGPYGEDGTLQGILEYFDIPYTGPGVLASAIGMNKIAFRMVMRSENIKIPNFFTVERSELKDVNNLKLNFPYFVKPYNQGSSIGASVAKNKKELNKSLKNAFAYSDMVMVDEYIEGQEFTCTVLGNKHPTALPLVEIVPESSFFDYESKYFKNGTLEIVPARLSNLLTKKIQNLAVRVYKITGCKGFARVDFILKNNKEPVVLEINTIPGLTPASLAPKSAGAAGMSYSEFVDKIIQYALKKN